MVERASYEQIVGEFSYESGNADVQVTIQYPLITVDLYGGEGIHSRGNALCDANDKFSIDFGHSLAFTRALNRLTKRLERKLVQSKRVNHG